MERNNALFKHGAHHDQLGQASIATVGYADLTYQPIELRGYVNDLAREALMSEVTQRLQDGQVCVACCSLGERIDFERRSYPCTLPF